MATINRNVSTGPIAFTFYGDLLGIAAAYRLSPQSAYEKLDIFYNTVFRRFEPICEERGGSFHVQMFSDSVVMWGTEIRGILEALQQAYLELIGKNLLLRGALVDGALQKEPRVEARGFRKFLPTNDTLARAVGLEKTVKGARLLIEPTLAQKLLAGQPEWLTLEGSLESILPAVPVNSMLRRISPSPSGTCYELLYFWRLDLPDSPVLEMTQVAERLKELVEFQDTNVAEHLRETLKVLKRSQVKRQGTERGLRLGIF